MRLPAIALFLILAAGTAWAEAEGQIGSLLSNLNGGTEYQLGGAIERSATVPAPGLTLSPEKPRLKFSVPRLFREQGGSIKETAFGKLRVFFGEGWNEGRDVFHLGTAFTRGQATAGVSVTYQNEIEELSSSELYLDYALTENFSIGVSGILNEPGDPAEDRQPQFGLNAELSTSGGTFLRGGITGAQESDPSFGLAIGLRF